MSYRLGLSLPAWCALSQLPTPVAEHRFSPPRRWRFDWAFLAERIAVEQEGGIWTKGRHTRGAGVVKDMEKYNQAAIDGWCVLRATPDQIASGAILETVRRALQARASRTYGEDHDHA